MSEARVRLAPGVRRPLPELLLGGSPLRVLRLSPAGVRCLDTLLAGQAAPGTSGLRARLREARMLLVEPGRGCPQDVTVVVPVRGTSAEVQVVLEGMPPGVPVVVVDDGSPLPLRAARVQVLRRPISGGPAAARNAGAAQADTRLLAFVDADVRLPEGWLDRLTGHFADARVVAVAPRVRSGPAPGLAGLLEQQLSALDLGGAAGEVEQGSRLSYVPSTVLLVRREVFEELGGFDERLQVGEDVDLVWRLSRVGVVRYDPEVEVVHGARRSLRASLGRRREYGTSAGPLDLRHPGQVRHLVLSPWTALPWLGAVVHPAAALLPVALLLALGPRSLPALPRRQALQLVAEGQLTAAAAAGRYVVRPGLPMLLMASAATPRVRRLLPFVLSAWAWSVRRDIAGGPRTTALRVLDDLAYTVGVWQGCATARRWRPLVPGLRW